MVHHRILMVSDFFWPGYGGVEVHIYNLAQCLIKRGHKVVVATRSYGDRRGIRYMTNGLKVYYVPFAEMRLPAGTVTTPTVFLFLPLFRNIVLREGIDIVHGHQTTSSMCQEGLFHAKTMGLKTVFTDHSLFGFADSSSIHSNKLLEMTLAGIDHVICVSHTSKENLFLRARMRDPGLMSVIPNATDTTVFTPSESVKYKTWSIVERITIVVMARLVYRKGVDLMVQVIPEICRQNPNVDFIVAGDGPRKLQVEEMIERNSLFDRVELLGEVPHAEVKYVLRRGQIFLNCSLTEAFCIAIIEAASCGLLVVSTRVGGVPEVLPTDILLLAAPNPAALVEAVHEGIAKVGSISPWELHERVVQMYCWDDIARRTEAVYDKVAAAAKPPFLVLLKEAYGRGTLIGKFLVLLSLLDFVILKVLEWIYPSDSIDPAIDFPYEEYALRKDQLLKEAADRGLDPMGPGVA
jgi:phosphatidylinositol glycan class A protein